MPVTINGTTGVTFNDSSVQGASAIGYSQTWTDVTSSRARNTNYTNTTGKSIEFAISTGGGGGFLDMVVSGISILRLDGAGYSCGTVIVPNGATYAANGSTAFIWWIELR